MPKNSSTKNFKTFKLNIYFVAIVGLAVLGVYFYYQNSSSYTAAREAKSYYDKRDYKTALDLALKVQEKNQYNIMAYTIVEQSKKAIKWLEFIEFAREYERISHQIVNRGELTTADIAKLRMMAEAVVYDYAKLGDAGILMHEELVEEAKRLDSEFRSVLEQLSKI